LGRDALGGTREFDWWNRGQDVALSVAQGLHFLHQNGVVHRYASTMISLQNPRLLSGCAPSM
jgi:hypothetical protein